MSEGRSIEDSIAYAVDTVNDREDELASLPIPIRDSEFVPEKVPENETSGQKNAREMTDSLKNAMTKSERLNAEREAREQKREKSDERKTSPVKHEDEQILRGIVEKAAKSLENVADPKTAKSPEVRKMLQSLRQRRPGANLGELAKMAEEWGPQFEKDPVAAREKLMKSYLAATPEMFGRVKDVEYEPGVAGALQRAQEDQKNQEELAEFMEKHGKDYPRILQQLVAFDENMAADPIGTSARLAAAHGGLNQTQPQQAPQPQHYTPEQERMGRAIERDIDQIISSGQFPGLDNRDFQDAVADVLLQIPPHIHRGDIDARFREAYAWVKRAVDDHNEGQTRLQAKQKRDAESLAAVRRGSKSVTGGKSHSASPSSSDGIMASLQKAKGMMA